MLTVNIICVGKLKEKYWVDAIAEYRKRLSSHCKFNIIELAEERMPQKYTLGNVEDVIEKEGEKILSKISKNSYAIALCSEGTLLSSEKLADKFKEIPLSGYSTIDFIIGGSWGLSDEVKRCSNFKLSMGRMTFPHQMARVILCEQIYRGFQINANTKYNK